MKKGKSHALFPSRDSWDHYSDLLPPPPQLLASTKSSKVYSYFVRENLRNNCQLYYASFQNSQPKTIYNQCEKSISSRLVTTLHFQYLIMTFLFIEWEWFPIFISKCTNCALTLVYINEHSKLLKRFHNLHRILPQWRSCYRGRVMSLGQLSQVLTSITNRQRDALIFNFLLESSNITAVWRIPFFLLKIPAS